MLGSCLWSKAGASLKGNEACEGTTASTKPLQREGHCTVHFPSKCLKLYFKWHPQHSDHGGTGHTFPPPSASGFHGATEHTWLPWALESAGHRQERPAQARGPSSVLLLPPASLSLMSSHGLPRPLSRLPQETPRPSTSNPDLFTPDKSSRKNA